MSKSIKTNILFLVFLLFLFPSICLPYSNLDLDFKNQRTWSGTDRIRLSLNGSSLKIIYRVQKNDNLWEISQRFQVELEKMVRVNNLLNPDTIFPGDEILINIDGGISPYKVSITAKQNLRPVEAHNFKNEPVLHVILPDASDPFAPLAPQAFYETNEASLSGPRKSNYSNGISTVFESLNSLFKLMELDFQIPIRKINHSGFYSFTGFHPMAMQEIPDVFSLSNQNLIFIDTNFYDNIISSKPPPPPKYM